ncbi:Dihydrolipoyl dehydrogenase [Geodia barretti]|uniref:dihydrolipoyl dehydrogenase n=1 Tax=Geodia barretti TaxID=519541 RepID=A0AA35SVD0_GEOBA|nr:Dihydrolipoyl dehydrogenase [Geodia barretti]
MMKTNVEGIYAIGDVTGKMPLAHVASAQGVLPTIVAHPSRLTHSTAHRLPSDSKRDILPTPSRQLRHDRDAGQRTRVFDKGWKVPTGGERQAALALNETEGMIKLVVDAEIGEVLGAHMIGAEVTELLGEIAMTRLLEAHASSA